MASQKTVASSKAIQQLSLEFINEQTPMGARLLHNKSGATFKVWAPRAREMKRCW